MTEIAFIDLPGNRCHWTAIDTGQELTAACGLTRCAVRVQRVSAFVDGAVIPACPECAEIGQPKTVGTSRPEIVRMPWEEFEAAAEAFEGFCTTCNEITNSGVEPDASRYECESCGNRTVYGMAEALLNGSIQVEDQQRR
jgi:hypothetical protein